MRRRQSWRLRVGVSLTADLEQMLLVQGTTPLHFAVDDSRLHCIYTRLLDDSQLNNDDVDNNIVVAFGNDVSGSVVPVLHFFSGSSSKIHSLVRSCEKAKSELT